MQKMPKQPPRSFGTAKLRHKKSSDPAQSAATLHREKVSRKPYSGHLAYSIRKRVKSIENQEKPKRKTHTSNEVKKRCNDKTYQERGAMKMQERKTAPQSEME